MEIGSLGAIATSSIIAVLIALVFLCKPAYSADNFELKTSGYLNLTSGGVLYGASSQTGSSVGLVPEGEIEFTPQYHLAGGTILAARVAINANADVEQAFQSGDLMIPEVSAS